MAEQQPAVKSTAYYREVSPELALSIGKAVGQYYKTVAVGCDMHPSTAVIDNALRAGLIASGVTVLHNGVIPASAMPFTPGGPECYITIGTHRPEKLSDIWIHLPDGSYLNSSNIYGLTSKQVKLPGYDRLGSCVQSKGTVNAYAARLKRIVGPLDCAIAIDVSHPIPSVLASDIANDLGAETVLLTHRYPKGTEGILQETDLRTLKQTVVSTGCNLGVSLSHDGGRLDVCDENGELISPEKIPLIIARHFGMKSMTATMDFSNSAEEVTGGMVIRTGLRIMNVSNQMKASRTDIGADSVGHVIISDVSHTPDGICVMLLLAKIASEYRLSELAADFPESIQKSHTVHTELDWKLVMHKIGEQAVNNDFSVTEEENAIRGDLESGWFLAVYDPGTKVITLTTESSDEAYNTILFEMAKNILNDGIKMADQLTLNTPDGP